MAATTQVKFAAAFRASVPLGSAGIRAGCIAPIALPTGTLIRPLEAVSATCLNESPLHTRRRDFSVKPVLYPPSRPLNSSTLLQDLGQTKEPGPRAGPQWPGPLEPKLEINL
jgi:hypothetical protein